MCTQSPAPPLPKALARQHEAQLVVDDPPGEPLHPVGSKQLAAEAERLLDGMELAHVRGGGRGGGRGRRRGRGR